VSNIDLEVQAHSNIDGANSSISLSVLNGAFFYPEAWPAGLRKTMLFRNGHKGNRCRKKKKKRTSSLPISMDFQDDKKNYEEINQKKKLSQSLGRRSKSSIESATPPGDLASKSHGNQHHLEEKCDGVSSDGAKHEITEKTIVSPPLFLDSCSAQNCQVDSTDSKSTSLHLIRVENSKLSGASGNWNRKKVGNLVVPTSPYKTSVPIPQKPLSDLINDFGDRVMVAILEAISSKDNECRSFTENKIESVEEEGRMTMFLRHRASLSTSEQLLPSPHQPKTLDDMDLGEEDNFNKGDSSQTLFEISLPDLELSSEIPTFDESVVEIQRVGISF